LLRGLFDTLQQINAELGTTMLIVEQNANLALQVARTAYVLETGRIVSGGDAATIQADDAVRRAYLGY
jgi:branched-chain amino acid transport system ATP-binding protein